MQKGLIQAESPHLHAAHGPWELVQGMRWSALGSGWEGQCFTSLFSYSSETLAVR